MNYIAQSKRIKPNAKNCNWCKYIGIYKEENHNGEIFEYEQCELEGGGLRIPHRLVLKINRENDFRYCQHYRFSKENFKKWKDNYLNLQKFYDEELGKMEEI